MGRSGTGKRLSIIRNLRYLFTLFKRLIGLSNFSLKKISATFYRCMKMSEILNEGHKERTYCQSCGKMVGVTYKYKYYMMEDGNSIPNVLQGFCDSCGVRLLIPPQSIPKLKPFYQRHDKTQEYKVPNVIEDALLNISLSIKLEKPDAFKSILRFYLTEPHISSWIRKSNSKKLGPSVARLSFRIDAPTDQLLTRLAKNLDISKNQFVSRMIWDAKDRLLGETKTSRTFFDETRLLRSPEIILSKHELEKV